MFGVYIKRIAILSMLWFSNYLNILILAMPLISMKQLNLHRSEDCMAIRGVGDLTIYTNDYTDFC